MLIILKYFETSRIIVGYLKSFETSYKPLFIKAKDFMHGAKRKRCVIDLCSFHIECWVTSTWDPSSTQIVQGHVWKEECWYFVGASYDYTIDLEKGVQPPFGSIYNLWQNELAIITKPIMILKAHYDKAQLVVFHFGFPIM
jgi:hypothetical protein